METTEPPDHLRQRPELVVAELASMIISEMPHMPYTLGQELKAFTETRTRWDAQRLANTLRHACGRPGLADEIEERL